MGTGPYPTRRPFLAVHDIAWMPRVIEEGNSSANAMGRSENGKEGGEVGRAAAMIEKALKLVVAAE